MHGLTVFPLWREILIGADLPGRLPELPKTLNAPVLGEVDVLSLVTGFACGFVVAWILSIVLRGAGLLIKAGMVMGIMGLAGGGYYAEVRRRTGFGSGKLFESPLNIVDDTKGAAEALKKRLAEEKKALDKVD